MKGVTKLILDIMMGAVIPILILNNLTKPMGAPTAYVLAALVPVIYVLTDTLLISRRFNAITTYIALTAIMNGALAFWFVDGWRYALKHVAGEVVAMLMFFGSIAIGKPMMQFFASQVFQADTPNKRGALRSLFAQSPVKRGLILSTAIIGLENALLGIISFILTRKFVTATFGSEQFNTQIASLSAITRIAFPIVAFGAFGLAFFIIYRAVFRVLPSEEGKSQIESEFWDLMKQGGLINDAADFSVQSQG